MFGWIVMSLNNVEMCLVNTEVAGQSDENYHPDDVSGYSDQAVCSGCFALSGDERKEPALDSTRIRPFQPARLLPDWQAIPLTL